MSTEPETYEFVVRAERADTAELQRKLSAIEVLAADLATTPRPSDADALMHLAADVLLTLRRDAGDRELASRSFVVG